MSTALELLDAQTGANALRKDTLLANRTRGYSAVGYRC